MAFSLDYDTWKLQGCDEGFDDPRMPCRVCETSFEDHNDRELQHKFEPLDDDEPRECWGDD